MAKENRRFSVKGSLCVEDGTITEHDKDLGDIVHKIEDILLRFDGQDDVTLTLSYDTLVEGEVQ